MRVESVFVGLLLAIVFFGFIDIAFLVGVENGNQYTLWSVVQWLLK